MNRRHFPHILFGAALPLLAAAAMAQPIGQPETDERGTEQRQSEQPEGERRESEQPAEQPERQDSTETREGRGNRDRDGTEREGRDRDRDGNEREGRNREGRRSRRNNSDRRDGVPTPEAAAAPAPGATAAPAPGAATAPASTTAPAPGSETAARSTGNRRGLEGKYQLLRQRSIFARSGNAARAAATGTTQTAPAAPALTPEQAVVLIGVLAQDSEFVAFTENRSTGQIGTLRTGDDVAGGKVAAITLDSLAYVTRGAVREITLGQNLAGEGVAGGLLTSTQPSSSTASGAPSTLTPAQQSVAERLRALRKAQE